MKAGWKTILALAAPGLALALWLVLGAALLHLTLEPDQRAAVDAALGPLVQTHGALVFLWWALAAAGLAWLGHRLYLAYGAATQRLTDGTRIRLNDLQAPEIPAPSAATRDLAAVINELADERRGLVAEIEARIAEASRQVAIERDQLGALMAELQQSVIVCNLAGRILLFNGRAVALFRRLGAAPKAMGGSELIGLGRSIHGVIEPALITHALDAAERRIARGEADATARFVTGTAAGHLLSVSLAPVRPQSGAPTGYVLLLDDITDSYAEQSRRDGQLLELTQASRAALANIQAALDMLDYPDLDAPDRARFQNVVRDEVVAMGMRLTALDAATSQDLMTRWPLQDMLDTDILAAAARQIEAATGRPIATEAPGEGLWLSLDSFALIQALSFLATRLTALAPDLPLVLQLAAAGPRAHLDLAWTAPLAANVSALESEPITLGAKRSALTPRDVATRHGGEFWIERDHDTGTGCFRFLLPIAAGAGETAATLAARPEFYDFDLFTAAEHGSALDDRPLAELAYTVFDTETTGLDPAGGDEILQIGAVRIVNGRLLRGDSFEQIVDPGRSIPEASIPYHGIRAEMVRGQPRIEAVLPVFHAFATDTVLVGHNVAFDMRFLALKEPQTGLRFDQPVLDTLLLASIAHPEAEAQSMEAIAARLGIEVTARHSAAGDALTTAQIFLRLLPLLTARGITTLAQARQASESSYYARLRY